MSYSEILNKTTNRVLTQFKPHAVLALGKLIYAVGADEAAGAFPPFTCLATDIILTTIANALTAQTALDCSVRSATIVVAGDGTPTLTVRLSAVVPAGGGIELNVVVLRAAN
jgi:hypothetical protein